MKQFFFLLLSFTLLCATSNASIASLDNLSINGRKAVFDKVRNEYSYILTEEQLHEEITKTIEFAFSSGTPSDAYLTINGHVVQSGDEFSFGDVTGAKKFRIMILKGENELGEMNLYFTAHPIVQLYVNESNVKSQNYTLGKIRVNGPSSSTQLDTLDANIRYRGASTLKNPKKSFAIKLVHPVTSNETVQYENLDKSFLGMREDNSWILDAMVIDPIRLRNRVSTDLWNDFSVKPYYFAKEPKAINGTRGKFVELYINDTYNGLYCLTETVNRKQLKLKKFKEGSSRGIPDTIRGLLYKAVKSTAPTLMRGVSLNYDNASESWDGWESKYPDASGLDSLGYTDWKPLYDAIVFVVYSTNAFLAEKVGEQFDLPVFRDYYLFIELLNAKDNYGKNTYLSIYDKTQSKKISITPWDLDGVFGRYWDGSTSRCNPRQNYNAFTKANENEQNMFYKRLMQNNVCGFNDSLKLRYAQLRKEYFKPENLIARFVRYNDELVADGAANREVQYWLTRSGRVEEYLSEMSYLSTWINARVAYLDTQYGYIDTDEPLMVTALKLHAVPNPVSSLLIVSNLLPGETVTLHNQQGQLLREQRAEFESMAIDFSGYSPGLYILKAGNRTEKIIKQ
ncbi:MAG: CotH kinase family protein [Bacteroidales bacterium]|nr:CotH kinase family protein [Bacteroidales bacterium]